MGRKMVGQRDLLVGRLASLLEKSLQSNLRLDAQQAVQT